MRQSQLFPKTKKLVSSEAESLNHQLLVRAGFMDQLMAGSWTLLPMGFKVVQKINQVIREELDQIGCQELLMPLLHPKNIWNETGRWDSAKEVMYQLKAGEKEYGLSFTHEEIVMDLLRKHLNSYQDLPVALYHFSTKFRNEARARSGILRGREFMMKDLYSAHVSEKNMLEFYEKVKAAYLKIFERLGFEVKIIEASGGVFTKNRTHEFQVLCQTGEDTIYYCNQCSFGENKEIFRIDQNLPAGRQVCPICQKGKIQESKAIEVGNIFPLGTYYAEKMGVNFTDSDGKKKPVWFASYGIGSTRLLGTYAEVFHDEKGLIWPKIVAPYQVHLVDLNPKSEIRNPKLFAEEIYEKLEATGIEVLYDDRQVSAGEKFSDADLIGIPVRLVISPKTGEKIEWKERNAKETLLLALEEVLQKLRN